MSATTEAPPTAAEATYVYGVIPAPAAVPEHAGFGPIRTIPEGDLQAVVSSVAPADWAPEALTTREALGERAQRHQQVLGEALAQCTPLPMRLGTILRGDAQVSEFLRRAYSVLADALAALQGRQEWGIKLQVDRAGVTELARQQSSELQLLGQRIGAATEGTRYLLEKRRDRMQQQLVDAEQARLVRLTRDELGPLAEQRVALAARDDCALNDSLLVSVAQAESLARQVELLNTRLQSRGAVELTGPWPPYSFAPVVELGEETQRLG